MSQWTDKVISRLRELIAKGEGSTAVANQLNAEYGTDFTRNAIIGKAHRLNIIRVVTGKVQNEAKKSLNRIAKIKAEKTSKPKTEPVLKPVYDPKDLFRNLGNGRPMLSRKFDECAWPMDDEQSCCQPITRGSYCAFHASIAYKTTGADEKALARSVRKHV